MHPSSHYSQYKIAKAHVAEFHRQAQIGAMAKRRAAPATAVTAAVTAGAAVVTVLWLAGPAGASPAARPAVSGTESIQLVTTSATSSTSSAIATGVFTAGGVDHAGSKVNTLVFPGGTYKVAPSKGTGTQTLNPKTCLLTVNEHGTYKAFGGTGKFAGTSGHGTYHVNVLAVLARSGGKCAQAKPPLAYQQIIRASGHVKF